MIVRNLTQAVLVGLAAAACWGLAKKIGPWTTVGVWSTAMALATVGAALLLRSSPVGKISWKNRVGGWLLPWGYTIGRGQLPGIVATSWCVWVLIAISVCVLAPPFSPHASLAPIAGEPASPATRPWIVPLLLASWLIDGGALLYLIGVHVKNFRPGSTSGLGLLKIMAVLVALLGGSIALWLANKPGLALTLAGGPPLLLALLYGGFIAVILTAGKNARWN